MAERVVENAVDEAPEIPEILERILLFALDEAKEKMEQGEDVIPFTALAIKDNVFIETHPGDDEEECFNYARHTVQGARGADAYAFCYDGYIDTDDGMIDALIAEGGLPGEMTGCAVSYLYSINDDEKPEFETEPAYVGEAPNFMLNLKEASEYSDDEIDEKYLEELDEEEDAE